MNTPLADRRNCLDRLGYRRQVMEPRIRPLSREPKLAGFAVTVHCVEMGGLPADPDDYRPGPPRP
jgi:regulator of RNase E activity RraA